MLYINCCITTFYLGYSYPIIYKLLHYNILSGVVIPLSRQYLCTRDNFADSHELPAKCVWKGMTWAMFSDTISDILPWFKSHTTPLQLKVMLFWAGIFLNRRSQIYVIKDFIGGVAICLYPCCVCVSPMHLLQYST